MKIESLQVCNYRSFGSSAHFNFESNIMALIGRNGVGKSNALEALSRLKFFANGVAGAIPPNAVNQNSGIAPEITVSGTLDDEDLRELEELGVKAADENACTNREVVCRFRFDPTRNATRMAFEGWFHDYMHSDAELRELDERSKALVGYLSKAKVLENNVERKELIEALSDFMDYYVPGLNRIAKWCKETLYHHVEEGRKEDLLDFIEKFRDKVGRTYGAFGAVSPKIFLFEDAAEFPNGYKLDDIIAWDQNNRLSAVSRTALTRFLDAVGSTREELVRAFQENDERERRRLQSKIANAARRLSRRFNESYRNGDAEVELDVSFDGNVLRFSVGNADIPANLVWSDTSAGVRWYLSVFLEIEKALVHRNVILLVDEPAIHLHVTAQREALALLQRVASGTRYVVYTTHSPYMMDMERLGDVRAIVREGDVSSIRTLTGVETAESRQEVLTPVCHALGYSMSAGIVPDATRLNVVVEGITDAIYMQAMMRVLGVDGKSRPYVLPCQGAPSVPYVVPLLIGWGLRFRVLLDRDPAGFATGKLIGEKYGRDVDVRYVGEGDSCQQIENLISSRDYRLVCGDDLDANDLKKAKVAKARRFAAMVDAGDIKPDNETRRNFSRLFEELERNAAAPASRAV